MEKTSKKVTKDPKRVNAARKSREKYMYMNKLKESILNDVKKGGRDTTNTSNETINASNETTSATTTRSSDTYIYGAGILVVLAIGVVCIFFTYSQAKNKNKSMITRELSMSKKKKPPKRRQHML